MIVNTLAPKLMKTELLTVSKIFHEAIFRIPDYQRGYSWEEAHLKDFWADLEQLDSKKSHYTGVLTLEEVPEAAWARWQDDAWIIRTKKYSPYYVVDGQQRLTTIIILLQCILETTTSDELNYTPIDIHRRKYIFETRSDSLARSYIFGYEKDNPSRHFLNQEVFADKSNGHATSESTIYTRNLRNAKHFFLGLIKDFSHTQIEDLFSKITQQLVFNAYEISKEIDVFVAFETMNNRGKPLSALELLKNRLIYLVSNLTEAHPGDNQMLRKQINESWAVVYHNLGRNEKRPLKDDEFLSTHLANFYHHNVSGDIPADDDQRAKFLGMSHAIQEAPSEFLLKRHFTRKRLLGTTEEHSTQLSAQSLQEYAGDLKSSAETYYKLSTPASSGFSDSEKISLERIGRLRGYGVNPIILAVYKIEKNQKLRASFLEAYERYLFCISLRLGYRAYGHHRLPLEAIKYIKGTLKTEDMINLYNNWVEQIIKEDTLADLLQDWTKNGPGYYGWRSVRYFLFEYELALQQASKTERQKIDWEIFCREEYQSDYISVEHIYPQRARAPYWTERFGHLPSNHKRILRNSLGNLLALSTPKNASLSNKSFPEKLETQGTTIGYRYGSYSENEVATSAEWKPDDIAERGIRMLSFMETRWKLIIGDRSQKIKALGIQSLYKR